MILKQSRRRRRLKRKTQKCRGQRGGASAIQNLQQWFAAVQRHSLWGKGISGTTAFNQFRSPELQLPSVQPDQTGFQLSQPLFEDNDIRQIGNSLRLTEAASMIAPGHSVNEFINRPHDDDGLLDAIEGALRVSVDLTSANLIDDATPYLLFYVMMNLPSDMTADNAIPLITRSREV